MVLLDLLKAFDTVDHNILCIKLKLMCVRSTNGLNLTLVIEVIRSILEITYSDSAAVTCGVPQGSILGPLLILCYVNDMVISIDTDCKLLL